MKTNYNFKLKFISPGVFVCGGRTIYHNGLSYIISRGGTSINAVDRDELDRDELDRLLSIHTTDKTRLLITRSGQNGKLFE